MSDSYVEQLRSIASKISSDSTLNAAQRQLALQGVEDALDALESVLRPVENSEPRRLGVLGGEPDGAGVVFGARPRRKRGAPWSDREHNG